MMRPDGRCCGNCDAYDGVDQVRAAAMARVGADLRGACRLSPQTVAKLPGEWCLQHIPRPAPDAAPEPETVKGKA